MDCVEGDWGERVVKLDQREAVPQSVGAGREHQEDSYKAVAAAIRIATGRRGAFAMLALTLSQRAILHLVARDRSQGLGTLLPSCGGSAL